MDLIFHNEQRVRNRWQRLIADVICPVEQARTNFLRRIRAPKKLKQLHTLYIVCLQFRSTRVLNDAYQLCMKFAAPKCTYAIVTTKRSCLPFPRAKECKMPDENQGATQQQERVSSDVVALCALLARIIMRCLREKDPHVMERLSLIPKSEGETPDAA
jgi:hypothetical protein